MPNFPFFRFPYPNYYYSYHPNYNKVNFSQKIKKNDSNSVKEEQKQEENIENKKRSSKYNSFGPIHFTNPFFHTNLEDPVLEILGVQLYLDDLIIIGLLFFLYKEGVQDQMLFLSLILLLLT